MVTRKMIGRIALTGVVAFCGLAGSPAVAQDAKIKEALEAVDSDVRLFNDHLMFLASPYLGGRLPGTPGMEIAKDYIEHFMIEAGLKPAFAVERDGEIIDRASYRQAFPLGGTSEVTKSEVGAFVNGEQLTLVADEDYKVTGMGGSGTVAAPITFVGYAINSDTHDYASFDDGDSLEGKIAMVLRFEPMDGDGSSLWNDGAWSNEAAFNTKIRAVADRNPEAIILVNTPGANDPRVGTLLGANNAGGRVFRDGPVIHMSAEAASRLVMAGSEHTLMELRKMADEGRAIVDLDGILTIDAAIERKSLMAENVGGLIPGKGSLANEIIVIGAHADHLGMGAFGSRASNREDRGTKLHPGADDNASGTAGILLIAKWLSEQYAELPDDANARSVLIVAFSGEESGLNGSRYYVENPIESLDQHYMMMNFDMIGRILNKRLSVTGSTTADGFEEWLDPFFDDSGLEIVKPAGARGGSDHLPFLQKKVPILFAIIADFHGDYHTPADISEKINRVDAVKASRLFSDIAFGAAQRPETLVWADATPNRQPAGGGRQGIRVRVGIMPGNYDGEGGGVLLDAVTEGGPADAAGLRAGDRIVRWDGQKVTDVTEWMGMLRKHRPGQVVNVGVNRDGEEVTLKVELGTAGG